jgi:ubiquinone/menaquinone biosynthesis C-methylase UbiE
MTEYVVPDYAAVTQVQRQTWSAGDFSVVALSIVPAAEALVAVADPHAGARVLDVACGSGNVALAAARRYCDVTGVDYVPELLERGRQRAAAEGTPVKFIEGDAQALPFESNTFDFVLSTFGVMFAPDQQKAARELLRVSRRGAKIAMANWPPDSWVGDFFRTMSRYSPPPAGLKPPMRWGTEQGIQELFGSDAKLTSFTRRTVTQYYRSVDHAVDVFRTYFGPTVRTFAKLDSAGQAELAHELVTEYSKANAATDGTMVLPLEYAEVVLTVN